MGGYNTLSARFRLSSRESWRFCCAMNAGRSGLCTLEPARLRLEKGRVSSRGRGARAEGKRSAAPEGECGAEREEESGNSRWRGTRRARVCTCVLVVREKERNSPDDDDDDDDDDDELQPRATTRSGERRAEQSGTEQSVEGREEENTRSWGKCERESGGRETETRIERVDRRAKRGREAERKREVKGLRAAPMCHE